ncbi:hypothetical protein MBLNU230_g2608t1 [Neophaeotheca triangularis]
MADCRKDRRLCRAFHSSVGTLIKLTFYLVIIYKTVFFLLQPLVPLRKKKHPQPKTHFATLLTTTATLLTLSTASPLYARSALSRNGQLRPHSLVTRDLEVLAPLESRQESSSSPTGSTSSDCSDGSGGLLGSVGGLLTGSGGSAGGCASSGEAASESTSSSTSASCQFLGGCTSSGSAACEVDSDDVQQDNGESSSSICGTSTSTDSSGFGSSGLLGSLSGGGGGGGSKMIKRVRAALSGIGA